MKTVETLKMKQVSDLLERRLSELPEIARSSLKAPGTTSLGAWFIGPKAENQDVFTELVEKAIAEHCAFRRDYFPNDPVYVTEEMKKSPSYLSSIATMKSHFETVLKALQGSVPFFNYRYQGHMNWDTTMPGILGYIAAMLYNPNNVAAEASPITTPFEMAVGDDLCEMLGYTIPPADSAAIRPWGHITADGTIANIEAMWASRNLKFYPVSVAAALRSETALAPSRYITVRLASGPSILSELSTWAQLNLEVDEVLALPARIQVECGISQAILSTILDNYVVQNLGLIDFCRLHMSDMDQFPAILVPSTAHYSWPKAAAILGFGSNQIVTVDVDVRARQDMGALRKQLDLCLSQRRPIIMNVAVMGSTEESAVDPLSEMVALRNDYRQKGLDYEVHADAAWGGYFASILRPSVEEMLGSLPAADQFTPETVMSAYVSRQYKALPSTDTITIDPHKAGFVNYPAGGLCYRNAAMRNLVAFTAPVVYHGGVDPTVGVYGVEGSKPGAAAVGVYLSHRVIRTDRSGYGKILGQSLFNSKRLYAALVTMAVADDPFIVVPLQQIPAEQAGESLANIQQQIEYIRREIVSKTNTELSANTKAMDLFRELGSDQVILAYTFNIKNETGPNKDLNLVNELNYAIFEALSVGPERANVLKTPLFVTSSQFSLANYGTAFMKSFRERLGVVGDENTPITFLISTTMDPWLTATANGSMVPVLIQVLRETVLEAVRKCLDPKHVRS